MMRAPSFSAFKFFLSKFVSVKIFNYISEYFFSFSCLLSFIVRVVRKHINQFHKLKIEENLYVCMNIQYYCYYY